MTKVAIYTIMKDEVTNVEAFMETCKDADLVLVGDTGSTDGTQIALCDHGAIVVPIQIKPWRFDVARNTVLSLVPPEFDLCFAMDADERFQPGWRDAIEPRWDGDIHHRIWFKYIHTFTAEGVPSSVGMKGFAHNRNGYCWKHRIHEELYWQGNPTTEAQLRIPELVVEHRQQPKETRDSYVEMLQDECASETVTARHTFWLCQELHRLQRWGSLLVACQQYATFKKVWNVEHAHCLTLQAAAYAATGREVEATQSHLKACELAPDTREPWLSCAKFYYQQQKWAQAYGFLVQCLSLTSRQDHYLTLDEAWGHWPHYMAAVCMQKLGSSVVAEKHATKAAEYTTAPHVTGLLRHLQQQKG